MMRSRPDRNWQAESEIREARADRKRHGRTYEQVRELYAQAAKSAAICGKCFRPLGPMDSVTMEGRKLGKHYWARVPICLLCTLTDIKLVRLPDCWPFYRESETRWHRTRCLNCGRPLRIQPPFGRYWENWRPSLNERTCCADCQRLARNRRNAERRRVEHQPVSCIKCGRSFVPKRDDAVTCSNRCRQALHRERARAELGGSHYPLRKPSAPRHRRAPR